MGTSTPLNAETRLALLEQRVASLSRANEQLTAQIASAMTPSNVRFASLYTEDEADWPAEPTAPGKLTPITEPKIRFWGKTAARSEREQATCSFLPLQSPVVGNGLPPAGSQGPLQPEWCPRDQKGLVINIEGTWHWWPQYKPPTICFGKAVANENNDQVNCYPCNYTGSNVDETTTFSVLVNSPPGHPTIAGLPRYPGVLVRRDDILTCLFVPASITGGTSTGGYYYRIAGGSKQVAFWGKQQGDYSSGVGGGGRLVKRCDSAGNTHVDAEEYTVRYPCPPSQYPDVMQDDVLLIVRDDDDGYCALNTGGPPIGAIVPFSGSYANDTALAVGYPRIAKAYSVAYNQKILCGYSVAGPQFTLGALGIADHGQTPIQQITFLVRDW